VAGLLFVTPNLGLGGVQRQWSILLPELKERGHRVQVLALDAGGPFADELRQSGIDADVLGVRTRLDVSRLVQAPRRLRFAPDVVVSHSVSAQVVGAWLARRLAVPHLVADHGLIRIDPSTRTLRLHRSALVRLVAPRADRVVAVTNASRPALEGVGYARDRIRVIPNGVQSTGLSTTDPLEVRRTLGIRPDAFVALLPAALRPEKRPDVFIAAIERARRRSAAIVGVVAGDGPLREEVRAAAGKGLLVLGLRTDVPALMASADVVCLTSDAEALPMAALEAMASRRPVVGTDVGGTCEAVLDGTTGYLVSAGDVEAIAQRLLELAQDPGLRRRMGGAGLRHQRNCFALETMVDSYDALVREVMT
jgi:glycosyltransferase involved in cell wall biosynthesis